jgi:hypothetical protein
MVDYYGSVYWCIFCFKDVASNVGFVESDEFDKMGEELTRSFADREQLVKRIGTLRNALAAVLASPDIFDTIDGRDIDRIVGAFQEAQKRLEANRESSTDGEGSRSSRSRQGSKRVRNVAADSDSADDERDPEIAAILAE